MDYQKFQQQLPALFNNWGESFCHPKSDIFQSISNTVNSMISPNVMQLLNLAVSCLEENEVYCEIGTFTGGSLISALINNHDKIAYAVDNFSELDEGENFDILTNNLEEFNLAEQVFFCCQDFEEFFRDLKNQELEEKIGVYFYDASQNYRSYLIGLLALKPIISNQAIIIITNCQWPSCQQAVKDFLANNSEAKLILDLTQSDYLLWNGVQILSWDSQREFDQNFDNHLEDNLTVDEGFKEAISNITKAEIAKFADIMEAKALFLCEEKQYLAAEKIYVNLLRLNSNNPKMWQSLGNLYYEKGEYLKALDCLNQALAIDITSKDQAVYHYTVGLILEKLDINQAMIAYERAIEFNPELVDAYNNLGHIYLRQNEIEKAEEIFQQSITANPLHFGGYLNLGNLLLEHRQQLDRAIYYYKKAFVLNENHADILNNLSWAYHLKNDELESLFYKGFYYFQQKEYEEAVKLYKQAVNLKDPDAINLYIYFLRSLQALGKTKEALEEVKLLLQIYPDNCRLHLISLQILPVIYKDIKEIEICREYCHKILDWLTQNFSLSKIEKPQNYLQVINKITNFYLAYQGKNDVDLQKQYGQIVHKIVAANYPQWCQDLPCTKLQPGEKIRVGYISSHLHNHNGTYMCLGAVKNHTRQNFEIYCYHIGGNRDEGTEEYELFSYKFVHIVKDVEAVCNKILADKLHILVIPAIGMEAIDGIIASLRLAPIQCTTWGHPITSGLPTMDYFLSSELMEAENGEEHYSETLIRLPNASLCYPKPIVPPLEKTRADFGIPEDCILYLSCQSTFKYLPQYDYIFAEIAKNVTNPKFVFIAAPQGKYITNIFRERLKKAFAKLGLNSEDYCIILPRQNHDEFLQLNLLSDIYLDTLAWSGGFTTLDAIACNLPIVTYPGEFMRGRHTYAFLKMLGITETIANSEAEYIEIAVKLGLDIDFRNSIIERTSKNHARVFEDKTAVQGLEAFFKQVVQEKSSLMN